MMFEAWEEEGNVRVNVSDVLFCPSEVLGEEEQ
jgi:hypothetical protein